jgi:predicted dehydrogenase
MTATLRYGLIGAGVMGRQHLGNLALLPGSSLAVIADPDPGSRAETLSEARRLFAADPMVFADHRELLASDAVAALIVAAPNDTHATIFAAPRAFPVLVE